MFSWVEDLKESNEINYENHKYKIISKKIFGNYRLDLLEDNIPVVLENTSNDSFLKLVNTDESVSSQILKWAKLVVEEHSNLCDRCKESKLVFGVEKYDKGKEFTGLLKICPKCRKEIYKIIDSEFMLKQEKKSKKFGESLKKNPPIIIGGFKERIEAYKYIIDLPEDHIEKIDKDFICAKAILKANDGTFYPVFCIIDKSSSGELWDSQFIADNLNKYIPQSHIFPYIGKEPDELFPYSYETLATIEEDFHQDTWLGSITNKNVKHHLSNLININWADINYEEEYIEKFDSVKIRTYFSLQHLLSVALSIKQIHNLDKKLKARYDEMNFLTYRSLCISAIFSAVSFLEAAINELFMDAYNNCTGIVRDLSSDITNELSQMWELGIPRTASYNIIQKYQIALALAKKEKINIGIKPAQDINSLIKLRNALVHYEPEWIIIEDGNKINATQKFEQLLRNRFELNPFTGEKNPFFPDKCLSLGCIEWALDSIIRFCDIFFVTMGIIPPYEKIRFKIQQILGDYK